MFPSGATYTFHHECADTIRGAGLHWRDQIHFTASRGSTSTARRTTTRRIQTRIPTHTVREGRWSGSRILTTHSMPRARRPQPHRYGALVQRLSDVPTMPALSRADPSPSGKGNIVLQRREGEVRLISGSPPAPHLARTNLSVAWAPRHHR